MFDLSGFKIQAAAYRQVIEKNPDEPNREFLERSIKIFDMLAELEEEDVFLLYNCGIFNDFTKAYAKRAMQGCNLPEEQIENVMEEIRILHDTVGAGQILE